MSSSLVASAEENEPDRIAMRTTKGVKARLERAAELSPPHDLTSFVLAAALEAAERAERKRDVFDRLYDDQAVQIRQSIPDATSTLEVILRGAISAGADGISIRPINGQGRCNFIIRGKIETFSAFGIDLYLALCHVVRERAGLLSDNLAIQDGAFRTNVYGGSAFIRVHMMLPPAANMPLITMRISSDATLQTTAPPDIPHEVLATMAKVAKQDGLYVVAGPTGSGKTTTINAALLKIDRSRFNVIAIEDPIEMALPDVAQVNAAETASTIQATLRHCPNVLAIGELHESDVAHAINSVAMLGVGVITTLHARTPEGAIRRLDDLGIDFSFVRGVVLQTTVPTLCASCKVQSTITDLPATKDALSGLVPAWEKQLPAFRRRIGMLQGQPMIYKRGDGCEVCGGGGFQGGLIRLFEIYEHSTNVWIGDCIWDNSLDLLDALLDGTISFEHYQAYFNK